MTLSVSCTPKRRVVKILDHAIRDDETGRLASRLVFEYTAEFRADRAEIPSHLIRHFRSIPTIAPLIKRQARPYFAHPESHRSPLARAAGKIRFDFCDGDTAFT